MTDQSAPALEEIFNAERLHAVIPLEIHAREYRWHL